MDVETEVPMDFQLSEFVSGLRLKPYIKCKLSRELRLYVAWLLYKNAKITCVMAAEMVGTDYRTFLGDCAKYRGNKNEPKSMNQLMEEIEEFWESE